MTKKKSTKRALISSLLILAMCFTMLAGTTFAWFTDSVESGSNIIKSGKLDIDLEVLRSIPATATNPASEEYVSIGTDASPIFNYDKWEPGYTEWANVRVINKGNLALKYTMKIAATGEVSKLAEVIDVYYKAAEVAKPANRDLSGLTKIGTLKDALAGNIVINDKLETEDAADYATIALHMQEDAGNEYQNLSIGSAFTFQILATQYTYEKDAFDDQYDAAAEFPGQAIVNSPADFYTALADDTITDVVLTDDVELPYLPDFANEAVTADLQGHTITLTGNYGIEVDGGNVEFKNGTIDATGITSGSTGFFCPQAGATLTLENVTIVSSGTAVFPNENATEVNIINCNITGGAYAVATNANSTANYGVVINIKGSTLSTTGDSNNNGDGATIMMNTESTMNIENSIINGHRQAIVVRAGTANVKNTTINYDGNCSLVASRDTVAWSSGNEVYGAAIVVGNKSDVAATAYLADAVLTLDTVTVNNTSERASLAVFGNPTYKGSVKLVNTNIPAAKQVIGDNASVA